MIIREMYIQIFYDSVKLLYNPNETTTTPTMTAARTAAVAVWTCLLVMLPAVTLFM